MPLVLVHNDVVANPAHKWNDLEGERYHYPSKYQSKIKTGETFVYYRGVHRDGGKRAPAEYVGAGRIGGIWLDPNPGETGEGLGIAGLRTTSDFSHRFRQKLTVNLEDIPANHWRDGVRSLDLDVYRRILQLASQSASGPPKASSAPNAVQIKVADSLIVPPVATRPRKDAATLKTYRKSKQAREVGDWAERVAVRFIQEQMPACTTCVRRAAMNETPGWDIDYLDPDGIVQRVEVKGTIAAAFTGIDMTANEIQAAGVHGQNYRLYLVAGCLTEAPKVQAIQNPAAKLNAGEWSAMPTLFAVRFGG